ncbi:hypothetical protein B0H13DRAFT_1875311 [Mycena leptocephala]|nr:hypothetical protein B0H13DRAFT_1875311 [Mycena leptocephala]
MRNPTFYIQFLAARNLGIAGSNDSGTAPNLNFLSHQQYFLANLLENSMGNTPCVSGSHGDYRLLDHFTAIDTCWNGTTSIPSTTTAGSAAQIERSNFEDLTRQYPWRLRKGLEKKRKDAKKKYPKTERESWGRPTEHGYFRRARVGTDESRRLARTRTDKKLGSRGLGDLTSKGRKRDARRRMSYGGCSGANGRLGDPSQVVARCACPLKLDVVISAFEAEMHAMFRGNRRSNMSTAIKDNKGMPRHNPGGSSMDGKVMPIRRKLRANFSTAERLVKIDVARLDGKFCQIGMSRIVQPNMPPLLSPLRSALSGVRRQCYPHGWMLVSDNADDHDIAFLFNMSPHTGTKKVEKAEFDDVMNKFRNLPGRVTIPPDDLLALMNLIPVPERDVVGSSALFSEEAKSCAHCLRVFSFLDIAKTGLKHHTKEFLAEVITGKLGYFVNDGSHPFDCANCGVTCPDPCESYSTSDTDSNYVCVQFHDQTGQKRFYYH